MLVGLVEKVGPQLKSLTIEFYFLGATVLRALIPGIRKCTSLQSVLFRVHRKIHFGSAFWSDTGRIIGKNIEKLHLQSKHASHEEWTSIFHEVALGCPVLKDVKFFPLVSAGLEENFVKFLEKLGKQLVNISLDGISPGMFPRIAKECPNLRGRCTVDTIQNLKGLENIVEDVAIHLDESSD